MADGERSVRVLGPVEVVVDGVVQPLRPMARRLLAVLAASAGRVVRTERILDDMWPEDLPATAAKTLQTHVVHLRRSLGAAAIGRRAGGYALDTTSVGLDAANLASSVLRAEAALGRGEHARAAGALDDAVALLRGVPFDEFAWEPFAAPEVARLQELAMRARLLRASTAIARGAAGAVVGDLEQLVIEAPFDESVWAALVTALTHVGRRGDAVRAGERAVALLAGELGAIPGDELSAAIASISAHAPIAGDTPPARASGSVPRSLSALERGTLVGREHEMRAVASFLADEYASTSRVVVVTGEPGIGKSRLAAAAVREVGDRYRAVLFGRCDRDVVVPYRPFVEMFRQTESVDISAVGMHPSGRTALTRHLSPASGTPALSDADLERSHLRDAIVDVLRWCASDGRVLLVIDDLHWSDDATLDLLSLLIDPAVGLSVDVVVTARPGASRWQRVASDAIERAAVLDVALDGIALDAVEVLTAARLPDAPATAVAVDVHRATDGNPLLVTLFLDDLTDRRTHVADAVPHRVSLLVAGRLARVRPETSAVLHASAVAGSVSVELLTSLLGWTADAVQRAVADAEAHHLLVVDSGRIGQRRIAHELVRQAIYDSDAPDARTSMHARLAAMMADDPEQIDAVAFHWRCAGQPIEAARALLSKARRDHAVLLRQAALDAAALALELIGVDERSSELAIELELLRVAVHLELGDTAAARHAMGTAQRQARRGTLAYARTARFAARVAVHEMQMDEAAGLLRHCIHELDYLGGLGTSPEIDHEWCEAQIALGWLRYRTDASDTRSDEDVTDAMREIAERGTAAQRVEHAHLLAALGNRASRYRSPDRSLQLAQRSLLAARELGDPLVLAEKTFSVGFHLLWRGRLDEAEERLALASAMFSDLGAVTSSVTSLTYRAVVARFRGDVSATDMWAHIARDTATLAHAAVYVAAARANLAWVALRQGDLERAELESAAALATWSQDEHRVYPLRGLAAWPALWLAVGAHDVDRAGRLAAVLVDKGQQYVPDEVDGALRAGRYEAALAWAAVRQLC